jgi:TRAP-type C4-dicarboxylate transport system permease small subunit
MTGRGNSQPNRAERIASALERPLAGLDLVCRIFMFFLIAVIFVFTGGQAVDRYLLHTSFDAYEQIGRIGLVWLTFFGYALAFRDGRNLRIELLDMVLPSSAVFVKQLVFDLSILGIALVIHVKGWTVYRVGGNQIILGTPVDYRLVYAGVQVGTVMLIFFIVVRTLRHILDFAATGHVPKIDVHP